MALAASLAGYIVVLLGRRFSMVLPLVISIWLVALVWACFTLSGAYAVHIQQPRDLAIAIAVQFVLLPVGVVLGGAAAMPRQTPYHGQHST